jgi:hypothetical protein
MVFNNINRLKIRGKGVWKAGDLQPGCNPWIPGVSVGLTIPKFG